jgi:hypothetical protein
LVESEHFDGLPLFLDVNEKEFVQLELIENHHEPFREAIDLVFHNPVIVPQLGRNLEGPTLVLLPHHLVFLAVKVLQVGVKDRLVMLVHEVVEDVHAMIEKELPFFTNIFRKSHLLPERRNEISKRFLSEEKLVVLLDHPC